MAGGFKYGATWQVSAHIVNGDDWHDWLDMQEKWTRRAYKIPADVEVELVGMLPLRRGEAGSLHPQDAADEQTSAYVVSFRWWQQ